jgi:nicotinate-nucleotide--dimethylbenzimidazole phosphoribosyltransferase
MNLLKETIARIVPQDAAVRAQAHARLTALSMPYWALGRLLDLAEDLAGITR